MTGTRSRGRSWKGSPDGAVVLAVDGGGSKTDVAALTLNGDLVGFARGAGSNPQIFGVDASLDVIDRLVAQVLPGVGRRAVVQTGIYLSGLDLPEELVTYRSAISRKRWAVGSTGLRAHVENDLHALLRTGTDQADAVVVICGSGINAMGVRADGATVRFAALGTISGDWGGGHFLGEQAVWHAARSEDGRGPQTLLQTLVPQAFELNTMAEVSAALHFGRVRDSGLNELSPVLFAAAGLGDEIAMSVIERQAEEIVSLIVATLNRLDLMNSEVPVILGGGVLAAKHPQLMGPILTGLEERAVHAKVCVTDTRPIVGAAQLCLEVFGADEGALSRASSAMF